MMLMTVPSNTAQNVQSENKCTFAHRSTLLPMADLKNLKACNIHSLATVTSRLAHTSGKIAHKMAPSLRP